MCNFLALIVFQDPFPIDTVLLIHLTLCGCPLQEQKQLAYFIRHENVEITAENFQKTVQFGTVRRPYIDSLMRILNSVFLPRLFRNTTWPESIKNEFFSEIYHFMTSITGRVAPSPSEPPRNAAFPCFSPP